MAALESHHGNTVRHPREADKRLAELDLDTEMFAAAARRGEDAALTATRAHPRTAAGLNRWMETVAAVRSVCQDNGRWRIDDKDNRPRLIHKARAGVTLAFSLGDAGTGCADAEPNVARRKGPATTATYAPAQLRIEFGDGPDHATPTDQHWLFLYHRAEDEVRMEVSLPEAFSNGFVDGWRERIILDPLRIAGGEETPLDVGGTDVDFIVEPRNE
ncbi:hypothetical protein [Corynebacterium bovis]|uniref:hypothetical protein n=1 Tax=Corynebacterium bovis TaxID=36808 RepID=UPI00163AB3D5|nr:hypothetical protein [Corynebacterium bovis]MDN8578862.1 hypothetical protein [Corynebacterium bovis]